MAVAALAAYRHGLLLQHLVERARDSLDLRAQHRLLANIHRNEQIRIRQQRRHAGKLPEGEIRLRQKADQLRVE